MSTLEVPNPDWEVTTMSDIALGGAFAAGESAAIRGDFPILSRFVRGGKPLV